jgi:outer membrane protein
MNEMKSFGIRLFKIMMFFIPVCGYAQDTTTKKLSLSTCIQLALKNNLDAQKSEIQSENARINLFQSRENILPVVNANIQHGVTEGRSIDPYTNTYINQQNSSGAQDISSSLLLFNGLALQSMMRQSDFAFQASKAQAQQVKDNLTLNVILIYLQVLSNKDLLTLLSVQQETTQKQLERTEVLNDKGSISPAVYFDLAGQLKNDELAVLNAKNTLENSKIALMQLLNQSYDKQMEFQGIEIEPSAFDYDANPAALYKSAEQNLAIIKAADLNVRKIAMQIRYAHAGYYPSVYLRGGVYSNFSSAAYNDQHHTISYQDQVRNNLGKFLNVGVAIPLFNNLRTKNNVSKAKLAYIESQLTAEATRKQLQQLTEQAYFNMITTKERCAILNEQVQAYTESFKIADVRFNSGVITSVDYLISKNNLEKTKMNLVSSRYDFILRKKIVQYYEGKL